MVPQAGLTENLEVVAAEVARSLSYAKMVGTAAFVAIGAMYPDGSSAMVRIDGMGDRFFVSDDGYGAMSAELMGATPSYNKIASIMATKAGIKFDQRSFFVLEVERSQLPGAVATIANTSIRAVERTVYAVEQFKVKRSRGIFETKLVAAFGDMAKFNETVRGVSREWDFDGVIKKADDVIAVFEFVSPAIQAVASAHMKLGDIHGLERAPKRIVTLADYDGTEPSLRSILSTSADAVLPVTADLEQYKNAA